MHPHAPSNGAGSSLNSNGLAIPWDACDNTDLNAVFGQTVSDSRSSGMTRCGRRSFRLLSLALISGGYFATSLSSQSPAQVAQEAPAAAIDSGSPVLSFEEDVVPVL